MTSCDALLLPLQVSIDPHELNLRRNRIMGGVIYFDMLYIPPQVQCAAVISAAQNSLYVLDSAVLYFSTLQCSAVQCSPVLYGVM